MATTSSAPSHPANEKSKTIGIGTGRCDFAPAWLKLANTSSATSSSSSQQQQQQHRFSSFSSSSSSLSSSQAPFTTPRARTPNEVDGDSSNHPHYHQQQQQPQQQQHHHPSARLTQSSVSSSLSRGTSGHVGGGGRSSTFSTGLGGGSGGGGGPRLQFENRPSASTSSFDRGSTSSSNSSAVDQHYVRRQKSLDSFGGSGGGGGRSDFSNHKVSPPLVRPEVNSRNSDSGFRGSVRGGRGRSTFEEDEHAFGATSRARGRQTNGSTPSTNPNYFYYGTPPTPPNNSIVAESRSDSDEDHARSNLNGGSGGFQPPPTPQQQPQQPPQRHDSSRSFRVNGCEGDAPGDDAAASAAAAGGGIFEWRSRRGGGASSSSSNGADHSHQYEMAPFGGSRGSGRDGDRGSGRDGDRGKRHSSGSNFDGFSNGRGGGAEERRNGGGSGNMSSGASGGGVMESAIGYWEYDPAKEEAEEANRKREPPPPDAEEEFPSLGGSHDSARYSGNAVWLGKQNSQTIVSSSSTRVQLKQQHVMSSTSGGANVTNGSIVNGSALSKPLMPPKMSRPLPSARPPSLSSNAKSNHGISPKEASSSTPSLPISAPALMEISRIVKPLKIREEKKSQFLRALRGDSMTSATHSNHHQQHQHHSDNGAVIGLDDDDIDDDRRNQQHNHHNHVQRNGSSGGGDSKRRIDASLGSREEMEEEMEDVFPSVEEEGKRKMTTRILTKGSGGSDGIEGDGASKATAAAATRVEDNYGASPALFTSSSASSSGRRRRPSSSSSSGASMPSVENSKLSSSLEAEQRLLREMGWEEEEEEDDWQLSEDELREVQAKIQEIHRNQHRSLTPLTLNVLASTFNAVTPASNESNNRMSTSEGCTPTDPDGPDACHGFEGGRVPTAFVISGFENNNHKTSPSFFIANPDPSPCTDHHRIFQNDDDVKNVDAIWNNDNTIKSSFTSFPILPTPNTHPSSTTTTTTTTNPPSSTQLRRVWQSHIKADHLHPEEETDSDLSDVESD